MPGFQLRGELSAQIIQKRLPQLVKDFLVPQHDRLALEQRNVNQQPRRARCMVDAIVEEDCTGSRGNFFLHLLFWSKQLPQPRNSAAADGSDQKGDENSRDDFDQAERQ